MKLVGFRITNYRSIKDSGPITASKITSLVGRNESGKSNILLALATLNPAGGAQDISPIKNFPRDRRLAECKDDTPVVHTTWELDNQEQADAIAEFPRALGAARVEIARGYKATTLSASLINAPIFDDERAKIQEWILARLPTFIYVADFPELNGHQDIAQYITHKAADPSQLTPAEQSFEKVCKVAGIDPQQLHELNSQNDHETRNQLVNRASAVVTSEIRRLWKDRELKVRFNVDGVHLDTFISDPNTIYDVEVNLDERSRGLKWFFSFYITFSADTQGGPAHKAILLLDEPGIHLHALSQGDLLRHLAADFENQIIYTTHSPFMVPVENLDTVRTVNITQDEGTTVTDTPTGDSRTLYPLQTALGISLSQSLFVGPNNIVVEGVTDYWILSAASEYLESIDKQRLPKELVITPAGGAQKVGYMVALLTSERLRVLVLLDDESQTRRTREDLVKAKLIRDDNVMFVTEAFEPTSKPTECDIEDLLEPGVYDQLVQESYAKDLQAKTLKLNPAIPRIVKRYEKAFEDIGLEFHKTRPARLLLTKMGADPGSVVTSAVVERFERLFKDIEMRHRRNSERSAKPFR